MRLALILALTMTSPLMASDTAQPASVPLFGRTLSFRLPADMVVANSRDNGTNILIEYVPEGETLTSWTRLVTVQAYRGLGKSPMGSAEIARQAFYPAACKTGPIYRDGGERILASGLKRTLITNGCASLPAGAYPKAMPGAGELDFILMFRDDETIYTLNYALRSRPFTARKAPIDIEQGEALLRQVFGEVQLERKH